MIEALAALEFVDQKGDESISHRFNVPTTLTAEEGAEIERIMERGAPLWVRAIWKRLGR